MTIHVKPSLKSFASGIREIATDGHGTDDSDCYREKCEYENSLWPESSFENNLTAAVGSVISPPNSV